ncbi:MAG: ROK family protein [Nanoarchaeota archaeon]
MKTVIGIDAGGTSIRAGLVTKHGKLLQVIAEPTPKKNILATIKAMIKKLRRDDTIAVGIGIAGPIDQKKGTIYPPNIPSLKGTNLKKAFRRLSLPVVIENDSNCFILAEQKKGAAKGYRDVIGITIGTGIGGGIIINNNLYTGKDGSAGEFGHITIDATCQTPGYPINGSLESMASGRATERRARELVMENTRTIIRKNPTMPDIITAAKQEDSLALMILDDLGRHLGTGIASILNAFDPECIVLGGSVAQALPLFRESMKDEIKKRSVEPARSSAIIQAKLDHPGIIGAALAAASTAISASERKL